MKARKIKKSLQVFGLLLMLQIMVTYKPFVGNSIVADASIQNYSVINDLEFEAFNNTSTFQNNIKMKSAMQIIKPEAPKEVSVAVISYKPIDKPVENYDVTEIIRKYATEFGLNESDLISISYCESGFRPNAQNGDYGGIFQFSTSTWQSNRKAMGLDPNPELRFNPEEAAKTAAFKMSRDGYGAWPACSAALIALK